MKHGRAGAALMYGLPLLWLVFGALLSGLILGTPAFAAGATSITRTFQAPTISDAGFRDSYLDLALPTTNFGAGGANTTMIVGTTLDANCITAEGNGGSCRRAPVWFDVSSIPGGSTVSASSVDLNATVAGAASRTHGLHKLTAAWTEAGVTWNTKDGVVAWTTAGGDFSATASQTLTTGTTTGVKTFANIAALQTDVSGWINTSSTNFGWIVKDSAEAAQVTETIWTYGTKENATAANRPKLSVTFTAVWDSYNNVARTVQDDTFATGENTVYMRGTGFNLVGSYVIGYYDGLGDKRCTETIAASAGTLDSSCAFLGAAATGTWHAVTFQPGITSPATYASIVQDTHKVVADDTFTVQTGAVVPEIPGVAAAMIIGMATVVIFWWFSRSASRRFGPIEV